MGRREERKKRKKKERKKKGRRERRKEGMGGEGERGRERERERERDEKTLHSKVPKKQKILFRKKPTYFCKVHVSVLESTSQGCLQILAYKTNLALIVNNINTSIGSKKIFC